MILSRLPLIAFVSALLVTGLAYAEDAVKAPEAAAPTATEAPAQPSADVDGAAGTIPAAAEAPATVVTAETAVTAEHGAEAAHHSSGLPQFNFALWPSQILWMTVFFVILYTVYSKAILPAIGETLSKRKQHIDDHIAKAEELSREAETIETQIRAAMREAAGHASTEIGVAEQEAKDRLATALADFRTRYEARISESENRIETAKDTAMADMNSMIAELSAQMVNKVAGLSLDADQAEMIVRNLSQKTKKAA